MLKDYDITIPGFDKMQEKQIKKFQLARELDKNGKSDEAIKILEKIFNEEPLLVFGVTWPMLLAN